MKIILSCVLLLLAKHGEAQSCQLKSQKELGQEVLQALAKSPFDCQNQSVHLTFDDGPSSTVTPILLQELHQRKVKATFFVSTTNLESSHRNHAANRALVNATLNAGHLIASHGHEHAAYDLRMNAKGEVLEKGFSDREKEQQINRSVELLNAATQNRFGYQSPLLFRFPYGRGAMPSAAELKRMELDRSIHFKSSDYADQLVEYRRQSAPLQIIAGSGFSHLGWNNDSGDSSYGTGMPSKEVLKDYVVKNLKSMCAGNSMQVSLFHDIKQMNAAAIPVILDVGKCLGLSFISAEQMMKNNKSLVAHGVLIQKQKIAKGPAESLNDLISKIGKTVSGEPECPSEATTTCYSKQYEKAYRECEGGSSICLGGRWYSRQDPMVLLNCNLKD